MVSSDETPSYPYTPRTQNIFWAAKCQMQKPKIAESMKSMVRTAYIHVTKGILRRREECILAVSKGSLVAVAYMRPFGHVDGDQKVDSSRSILMD